MKTFIAHALLFLVTLTPGLAAAMPAPAPFAAVYAVKIRGLAGEMRLSLVVEGEDYRARSRLQARGIAGWFFRGEIEETAVFTVDGADVVPLDYDGVDTLTGDGTRTIIQFDHAGGVVREWTDGELTEYSSSAPTYDRLSLQFALMRALAAGERPERFVLLDGEKKELDVDYGEGRVQLPYGEYAAVRVEHRRPGSSRSTVLWCAPELGFLPVRIEQYRKGKVHVRADLLRVRREQPSPGGRNTSAAPNSGT